MIQLEPTSEHPVPFDLSDEQPKTHADSIAVAVNTVDLINGLGPSIDFNNEDLHKAADLITGTAKPNTPKTLSKSMVTMSISCPFNNARHAFLFTLVLN